MNPDLSKYRTAPDLLAKIEKARTHVMTAQERYEQMVSFIWGMQKLSRPGYSHEQIKVMLAAHGVTDPKECATDAVPSTKATQK